jgi:hypothetical protein
MKRVEETGDWRKVNDDKLDDLYCSPNIVCVRLQWNVTYMGRKEMFTRIWWGNLKEREHL